MAKGNMLQGMAKGKAGNIVFSRLKGEQVSRVYNPKVKNPKTYGQALQRAVFATVVNAAARMNDVIDHTFDSAKDGEEDRQLFIKRNLQVVRETTLADLQTAGLNKKNTKLIAPLPYVVSEGALGEATGIDVTVFKHESGEPTRLKDLQKINPNIGPGSQITILAIYGGIKNDANTTQFRKTRFVLSSNIIYSFFKLDILFVASNITLSLHLFCIIFFLTSSIFSFR